MAPVAIAFMSKGYDQEPLYVNMASETERKLALAVPPCLESSVLSLPPGLTESIPPPKPLSDPTHRRRICYFQNRYHHQSAAENFQPCSAGDDCEFCHAFHPRIKRRNDAKTMFCTCLSAKCLGSDSSSTTAGCVDDSSSTSAETSDAMAFEAEKVIAPAVPPGLALSVLSPPPGLMESVPPPKMLSDPTHRRRICYFQNRYHHQSAAENFQPCSAGDDCEFCHAFHPRIKRRNDAKTMFCTCLSAKCLGSDSSSTTAECVDDSSSTSAESSDGSSSCSDLSPKHPAQSNLSVLAKEFVPLHAGEELRGSQVAFEEMMKAMGRSLH